MTTIKDVAKRAGVSIAAVSYCINGSRNLSTETRARINQAITDLHYVPNSQARNLKSRTSREICAIFPNLENPCYSELLQGIIMEAESQNYHLTVFCSYNDIIKEQSMIEESIGKNCAGILLVTCQPQHTKFFQNKLKQHPINTVFLVRLPSRIDAIYFGFDNYSAVFHMTSQLIQHGYRDVALLSGTDVFFSESEAVAGYQDAFDHSSLTLPKGRQLTTDTSKEGAFSTFLRSLSQDPPQAVITTSQILCQGAIEACNITGLSIPEDISILTLGVDNWNRSSFYPNIVRSAEPAYSMGAQSCQALINRIEHPDLPENRFHMFQDSITSYPLKLAVPRDPHKALFPSATTTLRIAAADLPTIHSIQLLSRDLLQKFHIELVFDIFDLNTLFSVILEDSKQDVPQYDLYLYDTSWFQFLLQSDCLMDLTDALYADGDVMRCFFSQNLENCCDNGRYYGVPVIGGTQFLLYRRDLFSDPDLCKKYKQGHKLSLRPPKTWKEFNSIARFFTREYNPDSPTQYGTAISTGLNEELALEFEPRMWGHSGSFFDSEGHLAINSPQNRNALGNFMESFHYSRPNLQTNQDVFLEFTKGNIPMIVTFTEYAAQILTNLHSDHLLKTAYSPIPGNTPTNVGWHLGLPKKGTFTQQISIFFGWLAQRHNSYYMSILGGASALVYPYQNHELQKLYPWLSLTKSSLENCRSRIYPIKKTHGLLRPNQFEAILCENIRTMPQTPEELSACLGKMQKQTLQALSK